MVLQDSILAQQIVSNKYNNYTGILFNEHSQIYIKSNERLNYLNNYFKGKNNALSVISCGDQIINMINMGIKHIDAFDISVFPKYYLKLKLGALKTLNKEQYIDMFYNMSGDRENYDFLYFFNIRAYLDKDTQEFWDSIINFFDWNEITTSPLFSSETISISDVINQNVYLQDNNYKTLKNKLNKVSINTYDGNILNLIDIFKKKKYDLVYLSNIIYSMDISEYKNILNNINLTSKGILITYLYDSLYQIYNYLNSNEYKIDEINNNCGLLIKVKKR